MLSERGPDSGALRGCADDPRREAAEETAVALLRDLLPIVDDLEAALKSAPDYVEEVRRARLEHLYRSFRSFLERWGVEEIRPSEGSQFDPGSHEVVGSDPRADLPEGHILALSRKGYRRGDRVLRPAQVRIARGAVAKPQDAG